jgi:hypothetical protein
MLGRVVTLLAVMIVGLVAVAAASAAPTFSNMVLRAPFTLPAGFSSSPPNQSGDSEPAIAFGGPGNTMAVDGRAGFPLR